MTAAEKSKANSNIIIEHLRQGVWGPQGHYLVIPLVMGLVQCWRETWSLLYKRRSIDEYYRNKKKKKTTRTVYAYAYLNLFFLPGFKTGILSLSDAQRSLAMANDVVHLINLFVKKKKKSNNTGQPKNKKKPTTKKIKKTHTHPLIHGFFSMVGKINSHRFPAQNLSTNLAYHVNFVDRFCQWVYYFVRSSVISIN